MIVFKPSVKDKTVGYIEGIIKLPISIVHNDKASENVTPATGRSSQSEQTVPRILRRICVGPAKFTQTDHTVWSFDQPSGKYLAFDIEWPETPKGSNYFEGYSILVLVTDDLHQGDMVLASTENGFRLLNRERGGRFTDAVTHDAVKRSRFIPIGIVWQESGWLKGQADKPPTATNVTATSIAPTDSKGHGFSRANKPASKDASALPQAGVTRTARNN